MRTCLALTSALGGALLAATIALPAYGAATGVVARDDSYSTAENTNLVIGAPGVLGNDTDADGDPLAAQGVVGAQHGSVSVSGNGAFTYVPTTNYVGPDQFTYQACEPKDPNDATESATAECDTATVFITVKGTTPTTTPAPTTTTEPPPVGGVFYRNCADALAAVGHPLRQGIDAGYRTGLDRDRDGIACEANEGPAPVTVVRPPTNTTIVNPPAQNTVINPPAPAFSNPGPVIVLPPPSSGTFTNPVVPSGPVATGDGTLADIINPVIPGPVTVTITVDLGNVLNIVHVPALPAL